MARWTSHIAEWIWGPDLLLFAQMETGGPCYLKLARHEGLKHMQGSGTTGAQQKPGT